MKNYFDCTIDFKRKHAILFKSLMLEMKDLYTEYKDFAKKYRLEHQFDVKDYLPTRQINEFNESIEKYKYEEGIERVFIKTKYKQIFPDNDYTDCCDAEYYLIKSCLSLSESIDGTNKMRNREPIIRNGFYF